MSFVHFVHNWLGTGDGLNIDPSAVGRECFLIPGEDVAAPISNIDNERRRGIAVYSADGQKILITSGKLSQLSFTQSVWYSSNGGTTYTRHTLDAAALTGVPSLFNTSESTITQLFYEPVRDRFYAALLGAGSAVRYVYSDDTGATWDEFTIGDDAGLGLIETRGYGIYATADRVMTIGYGPPKVGGADFIYAESPAPGAAGTHLSQLVPGGGSVGYNITKIGETFYARGTQTFGSEGAKIYSWPLGGPVRDDDGGYDQFGVKWSAGPEASQSFLRPSNAATLGVKRVTSVADLETPSFNVINFTPDSPNEYRLTDTGYAPDAGWVAVFMRSDGGGDLSEFIVYGSRDGVTWDGPFTIDNPASIDWEDNENYDLVYKGGTEWGLVGRNQAESGQPAMVCFDFSRGAPVPVRDIPDSPLDRIIQTQGPERWINFDDTNGSSSLEDLGWRKAPNFVTGDVTFQETAIYTDATSTAMTTQEGTVRTVFAIDNDRTHILIMDPANVAGDFYVTPNVTVGLTAANEITIFGVNTGITMTNVMAVQTIDGRINVYNESTGDIEYSVDSPIPSFQRTIEGFIDIGGRDGDKFDMYILIPNSTANVRAILVELGGSEPAPDAGEVAETASSIALFNMNAATPSNTVLNDGADRIGVLQLVNGTIDATAGQFSSGGLVVPSRGVNEWYLPEVHPKWVNGLETISLGTDDWTMDFWIKPLNEFGACFVGNNFAFVLSEGLYRRWGGMGITLQGGDGEGTFRLVIGDTLSTALDVRNRARGLSYESGSADTFNASGFTEWLAESANFVRICRHNGDLIVTVNGRLPTGPVNVGGVQGTLFPDTNRVLPFNETPIITTPEPFRLGVMRQQYDSFTKLAAWSRTCVIDGFRFVRGQAVTTGEFTVPTGEFSE